jgi:CubicO group peptidase (beta-lactamase class C family)
MLLNLVPTKINLYMKVSQLLFIVAGLAGALHPLSAQLSETAATAEFDKILKDYFKAEGPGAAVLVAKKGKIIYQKAIGKADLELDVPLRPDHVFRIGSVTKQFTAAAILRLAEEGKLSLTDELTKFIPDYPTQGKRITVEQLLNHTSGIKSYTNMEAWDAETRRKDFSPTELIAYFKDQPMEFDPGSDYNYNNSGYILLGYIIEKVSDKTYAQYIDEQFFKPLGMKNSYYGDVQPIIKNRADGYSQNGPNGPYMHAEYLSMTQPYAAGSLLSTVEDLFIWTQAVHSGKVLKPESLKKAFTPNVLPNGHDTRYGYGWQIGNLLGTATVEHGGGINGFLSTLVYLPGEDVCIAMLSNCDCSSPDEPADKMLAALLGRPFQPMVKAGSTKLPEEYVGVYENVKKELRYITIDNGTLYSQRPGSMKFKLIPYGRDKYFFEDSFARVTFETEGKGDKKIVKAVVSDRTSPAHVWIKTNQPLPVGRQEIKLPESELDKFTGEYELAPGFTITVTREGAQLYCQATGQSRFEVYPESPNRFFLKTVDAVVEFHADHAGVVTSMTLFQGGESIKGKRVK